MIPTENVDSCPICYGEGDEFYRDLLDRMYHIGGRWCFYHCERCGILWLNPRTKLNHISDLYLDYYTHSDTQNVEYQNITRRTSYLSIMKSYLLPHRDHELSEVRNMQLSDIQPGKLLDIGCGDGSFLVRMRKVGWDVAGVEPDPIAASIARDKNGINIISDSIRNVYIPAHSFDAITLSHVIEHIPDTSELIRICYRLLRDRGVVSIITPNISSLGHQIFKDAWFGLEPPRHFILFRQDILIDLLIKNGFRINKSRTFSRWAAGMYDLSSNISTSGSALGDFSNALSYQIRKVFFMFVEYWGNLLIGNIGEEIAILAEKKDGIC